MKYNLRRQEEEGEEEGDSDCEIQQLKQKIRLRRQQIRRSRLPPCISSQHSKAILSALNGKVASCIDSIHDVCIDMRLFFILFYIDWEHMNVLCVTRH